MKRFVVLMTLIGLSGACLADEPAFCKSMCTSEKSQCLANSAATEKKEALLPTNEPDKNPFARTAQVHTSVSDGGSLARSGDQYRRDARADVCDTAFQRCTRGCTVPDSDAIGTVVSRHAKKSG